MPQRHFTNFFGSEGDAARDAIAPSVFCVILSEAKNLDGHSSVRRQSRTWPLPYSLIRIHLRLLLIRIHLIRERIHLDLAGIAPITRNPNAAIKLIFTNMLFHPFNVTTTIYPRRALAPFGPRAT